MDAIKKTFIPGDEWLYIKLYTGFKTADTILAEIFPKVIKELKKEQLISRWFFIRYKDEYHHLRVRFYLNDPSNLSIIPIINQSIKDYVYCGLIWKVQIDTYQREIERYGEKSIGHAEELFFHDSDAIINLLALLQNGTTDQYRWAIALKMIDMLLEDFEFDINRKIEFTARLSESYKKEFGFITKECNLQLDKKFRDYRKRIEDIFESSGNVLWLDPFINIINEKSLKIQPIIKDLLRMYSQPTLEISLNDLLGSYIHMMINRLFRSKQRVTEMVLYDMLVNYYKTVRARRKSGYSDNQEIKEMPSN